MLNPSKRPKILNMPPREKKIFFSIYTLIFLLLQACVAGKHKKLDHFLEEKLSQAVFANQFTGFMVYDPVAADTLYQYNSGKYFTPASNTKIFTLYAGLKLLPANIPSLKYLESNDTLYIQGTGDPSLLHPYFQDSTALNFIKGYQKIALFSGNFNETHWGPGWAWEDYEGYYSPERTALPFSGNVVQIYKGDSLMVQPAYFRDSVSTIRYLFSRLRDANRFFYDPDSRDTVLIPFKTDTSLTRQLLEQATGKRIFHAGKMPEGEIKTLYGQPTDSLYKRMMQESDNFLAEQLLLAASGILSDTLNGHLARNYVLEEFLEDLPQPPVWVDGSGLSRYNLFSPEDMVYVLTDLYREIPEERLLGLFASGGISGTIRDWYAGDEAPYVFAKTGTLANNHCLSGYLKTRSGRLLIFSFMHNHFRGSLAGIKQQMQGILEELRDTY